MADDLLIPTELRAMAFVSRWATLRTIKRDYLAAHSYFVAVYSWMIAKRVGYQGNMATLLVAALSHDMEEIWTGDIESPTKAVISSQEAIDGFVLSRAPRAITAMWANTLSETESAILHLADKLDGLLFLKGELLLGNQFAATPNRVQDSINIVYRAVSKLAMSLGWQNAVGDFSGVPEYWSLRTWIRDSIDAHGFVGDATR